MALLIFLCLINLFLTVMYSSMALSTGQAIDWLIAGLWALCLVLNSFNLSLRIRRNRNKR